MIPYPEGKITVKQVAYLHAYCKESPEVIARPAVQVRRLGGTRRELRAGHLEERGQREARVRDDAGGHRIRPPDLRGVDVHVHHARPGRGTPRVAATPTRPSCRLVVRPAGPRFGR